MMVMVIIPMMKLIMMIRMRGIKYYKLSKIYNRESNR